jgi:hypothetical protein
VLVLATRGGVVRRAMAAVLLAANFAGVYEDDMAITLTMSLQTIMRGKMCLLHELYYYGYVYVDLCKKSTKNWGSDIYFHFWRFAQTEVPTAHNRQKSSPGALKLPTLRSEFYCLGSELSLWGLGLRSEKFQTFCGLPSPDSKFPLDTLKRCSIYFKLKNSYSSTRTSYP